jgi:ribosomal protein S18 acetylase RimI-like enzyme
MDGATLARLENDNMAQWLRVSCGQVAGSVVREDAGVTAFGTGLPLALFNQVVVTADNASVAGMKAAIHALQGRDAPFYLVLRRGIDDRFSRLAIELGLVFEEGILPGMALHPILRDPGAPEGHEIRRVGDAAGLDDHLRVLSEGFGVPEAVGRPWIGAELWEREGCTVYVGYTDGLPVSSGFGIRTGRTIGVYNIATLPSARRRGYGAAMTTRVVADGAAAGCDVAILQASELGRPIYERLGFRTVIGRDVYRG